MCIVHFYQQGYEKLDNSTKTQKVQLDKRHKKFNEDKKKEQKFG
jgi:hypothetical protein